MLQTTIDVRFFLAGSFAAIAWRDDANRVEGPYEQALMNTLRRFLANPAFS